MIGRLFRAPTPEEEGPKGFDDYELRLGDLMRGERATLGKSLLDVQRELKIKASYIAAIENADVSAFETPGFVAGYVLAVVSRGVDSSRFAPAHRSEALREQWGAAPDDPSLGDGNHTRKVSTSGEESHTQVLREKFCRLVHCTDIDWGNHTAFSQVPHVGHWPSELKGPFV